MKSLVHRSYILQGFAGALLINLVLFCSLPALISLKTSSNDIESLNLVYVSRFKPEPVTPKPKEKPPEKKETPKPEIHKVIQLKPHKLSKKELKRDMPKMNIDINPKIAGDIPMITMPSQPVVKKIKAEPLPDFNTVMDQSEVDTLPVLSFKKNPRYPYHARRIGIEGDVKIRFLVDKKGIVSNIKIITANPPDIFNESIIEAVSSWKYLPGELSQREVATIVTTTIIFKLEAK